MKSIQFMHMDLTRLKVLENKYLSGNTTLKEERELENMIHHLKDEMPEQFQYLSSVFNFYKVEKEINHPANKQYFTKHNKRVKRTVSTVSIAASVILLILSTINVKKPVYATHQLAKINRAGEEQICTKTKEALLIVAHNLNKGKGELKYLDKINQITTKIIKNN